MYSTILLIACATPQAAPPPPAAKPAPPAVVAPAPLATPSAGCVGSHKVAAGCHGAYAAKVTIRERVRERLPVGQYREHHQFGIRIRARWSAKLPAATHEGELRIGDMIIPCAVLEGGKRILTLGGFMTALGRMRQAKGRQYYKGDVNMPTFLTAKNLKPFIPPDLEVTSQVGLKPDQPCGISMRPAL